MHRKIHVLPAKNARATPHNSRLTAQAPLRRLRHGICVAKMLDNVGLRYPHRASGAKAPRTLRPLPLLRFAVSATGGAHLCSIQYYLRFWLGICRTSLAVSALRIMRYCPELFEHRDNRRLYRLHRWHVCLRQRHHQHQPRRFLLVRLPAGVKQVAQKYDNQKQLPPPRGCFWFIKSHFAVKLKRFIKMNTTFLLYSTRKTVAIRARLQSCTQNPKND